MNINAIYMKIYKFVDTTVSVVSAENWAKEIRLAIMRHGHPLAQFAQPCRSHAFGSDSYGYFGSGFPSRRFWRSRAVLLCPKFCLFGPARRE